MDQDLTKVVDIAEVGAMVAQDVKSVSYPVTLYSIVEIGLITLIKLMIILGVIVSLPVLKMEIQIGTLTLGL